MSAAALAWDYLVLTASNATQARAYEMQLESRRQCGLLPQVREVLVVPIWRTGASAVGAARFYAWSGFWSASGALCATFAS